MYVPNRLNLKRFLGERTMMQLNCPACNEPISGERIIRNNAYCSCGRVTALGETEQMSQESILLRRGLMMVAVASVVAMHMITWHNHSVEIIPLKIKQMVGFAKTTDLIQIASICEDRKKYNCQIDALSQIFAGNQHEIQYLAELAKVQFDHNQPSDAAKNYSIYFKLGGKDPNVRFQFARVLAQNGQMVEARKQYSYLIVQNRDKQQFQFAREYVHFLMKTHDYPTAQKIISDYRKSGPSASLFLNSEWNEINDVLKVSSNRSPAAVTATR
jgi:hypothetical protein